MDTQYTQGFKAGMVWRETEIIKLLETNEPCKMKGTHHDVGFCSCLAIALIKGDN